MEFNVSTDKCKHVYDLINTYNKQNIPIYQNKLIDITGYSRVTIYHALNLLIHINAIEKNRDGQIKTLSIK